MAKRREQRLAQEAKLAAVGVKIPTAQEVKWNNFQFSTAEDNSFLTPKPLDINLQRMCSFFSDSSEFASFYRRQLTAFCGVSTMRARRRLSLCSAHGVARKRVRSFKPR